MAEIPANVVTPEDMIEWKRLQEELTRIRAAEMLLRQKIYKQFFPNAEEGTNNHPLAGGWVLKGKRTISRDIDLPVLQAMAGEGGPMQAVGIRAADLVEWKPTLKLKEYRTLTEEQRAVFDQALTIKDGAPGLEIVLPAKAARAQAAA